ncbi:hypothetical protein LR48_Vigan44s000400 [Vigna angularis]|uniref:Uncharacterized protein n=1 Tax=Phaseolus angularis TaxID=3914 RepID=A0A0L9T3T8_PHAAN|nr:hypothetical protein LR48_Vigan44s000400 [Vigna angularis]
MKPVPKPLHIASFGMRPKPIHLCWSLKSLKGSLLPQFARQPVPKQVPIVSGCRGTEAESTATPAPTTATRCYACSNCYLIAAPNLGHRLISEPRLESPKTPSSHLPSTSLTFVFHSTVLLSRHTPSPLLQSSFLASALLSHVFSLEHASPSFPYHLVSPSRASETIFFIPSHLSHSVICIFSKALFTTSSSLRSRVLVIIFIIPLRITRRRKPRGVRIELAQLLL